MTKSRGILPPRVFWTEDQKAVLRAQYPDTKTEKIATLLGMDIHRVYAKANELGLKKSEAFLASPEARRLNGKIGSATRFQKGQSAWNNGMKGLQMGGVATQFKPGQIPHTWKPIGSERISEEGYLQRKVADTGYPPCDWVGVHIIIWIQHNGPVPKGCVVVFKDGNKTNIDIDNLELLTRAQLMARNTIHNLPEELKDVIRLNGVIRRKIHGK